MSGSPVCHSKRKVGPPLQCRNGESVAGEDLEEGGEGGEGHRRELTRTSLTNEIGHTVPSAKEATRISQFVSGRSSEVACRLMPKRGLVSTDVEQHHPGSDCSSHSLEDRGCEV